MVIFLCNIVLTVISGLLRLKICVCILYSYCQPFIIREHNDLHTFTQLLTLVSSFHQITVLIVTSLRKLTQFHEKVSPTLRPRNIFTFCIKLNRDLLYLISDNNHSFCFRLLFTTLIIGPVQCYIVSILLIV
jgi:hypothetical protein